MVPRKGNCAISGASARITEHDCTRESRTFHSSAEWQLHKMVFQNILTLLGQCQVDLFATRLTHQLPQYVRWRPDPFAMATDAFQVCWTNVEGYAFPPFSLVGRCLQKVRQKQRILIIIAPVWPAQVWYPLLLELLIQHPVLLPSHPYQRSHRAATPTIKDGTT